MNTFYALVGAIVVLGTACDKPYCHEPNVPFPTSEMYQYVLAYGFTNEPISWQDAITGDTLYAPVVIDSALQCSKYRNADGGIFGSCDSIWTECRRGYTVRFEFTDTVLGRYLSYTFGCRVSDFHYGRNHPFTVSFQQARAALEDANEQLASHAPRIYPVAETLKVESVQHQRILMTEAERKVFGSTDEGYHRDVFTFVRGRGLTEVWHFTNDSLKLHLIRL
jgi:hypothetical protein